MNPDIEAYILKFPENIQKILIHIRTLILEIAPEAQEKISYGMPGFYLNKKGQKAIIN